MSIDILDTFTSFFVVFCKRISGLVFQFFNTFNLFFNLLLNKMNRFLLFFDEDVKYLDRFLFQQVQIFSNRFCTKWAVFYFIIYKVVKYRKILLIYNVYFIFSLVKI